MASRQSRARLNAVEAKALFTSNGFPRRGKDFNVVRGCIRSGRNVSDDRKGLSLYCAIQLTTSPNVDDSLDDQRRLQYLDDVMGEGVIQANEPNLRPNPPPPKTRSSSSTPPARPANRRASRTRTRVFRSKRRRTWRSGRMSAAARGSAGTRTSAG